MRKRERENPCSLCGHYHKYEEGEVCGICGHRMPDPSDVPAPQVHVSAFPSEILPEFLFLGSYDNASRSELLKTQGISRVLNTVPMCQNLYRNSFTYHGLSDEKVLQFDDAIKFLDQCEKDKARVLVHCMSGKSRSPAVVVAYLMKQFYQQLEAFEQAVFGTREGMMSAMSLNDPPTFGFGFPKLNNDQAQVPVFNSAPASSIFSSPASSIPPQGFTFGAAPPKPTTGDDIAMDGS
ncbi:hypothetical protein Bca4012_009198 [Brassica carinata]